MKQKFIFFLLFIISGALSAQTLYTRKDTIAITQDSVTLQAGQFRGKLQWQHSLNGKTWENLTNKTKAQLKVAKTAQGYYRAEITESTCLPNYSDTAVIVPKTLNTVVSDPDKISGVTLVDRNNDTFTYVLTPNSATNIAANTVLVDADKESDIRVVSDVIQKGDTLKVKTEPGTMEDLFVNQEFKLTTEVDTLPTKGAFLTNTALSKALTDKDGFIHPAEVYDTNRIKLKSAAIEGGIPIVNFSENLSGEKLFSKNGVELTITDGNYYLGTVLKCEFNFEREKFLWTKFPSGKLNSCKFYTDPNKTGAKSKLIVQAKASGKVSIDETFKLKPKVFVKSFKFWVGEVPVWMEVKIDLMAKVVGYFKSTFSVTGGASADLGIYLGAEYSKGSWNPFFQYHKEFKLYRPDTDGHVNYDVRMEVYPRTEITFYYSLGPVLEIVPYLNEHMDCSISGNYNFGLYTGLDTRVGVTGNILGKDISQLPMKEFNIRKDTIYEQPSKLEVVSGNNQIGKPNAKLERPIVLKVTDSDHHTLADIPVHFSTSSGPVDDYTPKTNLYGEVSIGWTLDNTEGKHSLEAYLEDGNDKKVDKTLVVINATCKSELPVIETYAANNITENSALCGGNITNNGGAEITARGVCWGTTENPTTANSKTEDGTGIGSFTSRLSGLISGTTYYVRAYTTNNKGTSYGNQVSFTTPSAITITTASVSNITASSATGGGTITSNKTITACGVCWNTTGNPTILNSKTNDGSGAGSFTSSITGLTANTTYYVRAYATNSSGTEYGNQVRFTTAGDCTTGSFTDSRDGHVYKTVQIGTQIWMAENLAYMPTFISIKQLSKTIPYYYKGSAGTLYNWVAAEQACPFGWHLPNDNEWNTLADYLGGGMIAGGKMKLMTMWKNPNTGASNESGFSAVPGGWCVGYLYDVGAYGFWWSNTNSGESAICWVLAYDSTILKNSNYYIKYCGMSVRCVKD